MFYALQFFGALFYTCITLSYSSTKAADILNPFYLSIDFAIIYSIWHSTYLVRNLKNESYKII